MFSRYEIPEFEADDYLNDFDLLPPIPEPNCISAGIQHNETLGRNNLCNFGCQSNHKDMCDIYRFTCIEVNGINGVRECVDDQRAGWAFPDCPKMLPIRDISDILYKIGISEITIDCDLCGTEIHKYLAHDTPDGLLCEDCFDEKYFICDNCEEQFSIDEMEYMGDDDCYRLCGNCYEICMVCDECGNLIDTDSEEYWSRDGDATYCRSCMDEHTVICDDCGDRYLNSEMDDDDHGTTLCTECRTDYYTCDGCGRFIQQDSDYYSTRDDRVLCDSCYTEYRQTNRLHDYGWCPSSFRFLQTNDEAEPIKYLGVELEVDDGNFDDAKEELSEIPDTWLCYDGSLSSDGIEIITHPATIKYHLEKLQWENITRICKRTGYKSHTSDSDCGLHVHVSKKAFGNSPNSRDKNLAKLLYIVEKFWGKMVVFSRRTDSALNNYARRYRYLDIDHDSDDELICKCKEQCNNEGRHFCVNLNEMGHDARQHDTIEIRIFRGTTKLSTIYATLQFCDVITEIAITYSLSSVQRLLWSDIKEFADGKGYTALMAYFKERGL